MKLINLILALSLVLGTVACGYQHAVQKPIPGAFNQFDSDTYVSLVTAKGAIDQARVELQNNAFSPSVALRVKQALNYAVTIYNTTDVTYQAYHNALANGTATSAQQDALTTSLSNLNAAVNGMVSAKVGK